MLKCCQYLTMGTHTSLLGLPSAIRLRIYRMVIPQLDLCNDLNQQPSHSMIKPYKEAYNLMLICCIIYTETSSILYSGNPFFIRYRDHGNLTGLQNLPNSVASIRRLTIHLNVSSCENNNNNNNNNNICCKAYRNSIMHDCIKKHDQPLIIPRVSDSFLFYFYFDIRLSDDMVRSCSSVG